MQQRVLPAYRVPFLDLLAQRCLGGLSVCAGWPLAGESIVVAKTLDRALFVPARNLHLLRGWAYLCVQRDLLVWLRRWDPEVLILEANPRYLTNGLARRWMQRRGRPVVGWGLGAPPIRGPGAGLRRRLRSRYLRGFDALIAYSTVGARSYERAGVPAERLWVAVNAVTDATPEPVERPPLRDRDPRVIFVGRLQPRKRVDLLLRACAGLPRPPEVWIVGDGPEREKLEELAGRICPKARFFGDQRGGALIKLLRRSDLFVLPGTGGLAVQQAMAHGLPVVAGEGDGTQRDLVREKNGWLLERGDLQELRAALEQALRDPTTLRRMGTASRAIVANEVNVETMAGVFLRVLNQLGADEGAG